MHNTGFDFHDFFSVQAAKDHLKRFMILSIFLLVVVSLTELISSDVVHGVRGEGSDPTENRTVVLELFTETWCGPCKNADLAADGVREKYNDDELVILEYHYDQGGDPFFTDETNFRFNGYYDFDSWPSAVIDGILEASGSGEKVEDVEERYEERIEERLAEKSHFFIKVLEPNYKSNSGYFRAYIAEQTDSGKKNVTAHTVIFRDKLHFDGDNGITEHRYVVRTMFSDPLEMPTDIVEYNFSLPTDSSYLKSGDNVGIVIFLQDDDTKEILQSKMHMFFTSGSNQSSTIGGESHETAWYEEPMFLAAIFSAVGIVLVGMLVKMKRNEARAMAHIREREQQGPRSGGRSWLGTDHRKTHSKAVSTTGGGRGHGANSNETNKTHRTINSKNKKNGVRNTNKDKGLSNRDSNGFTTCPHCKTRLKMKNLESHMNRVHPPSRK